MPTEATRSRFLVRKTTAAAGAAACFFAGAIALYVALIPTLRYAETAPFNVLTEQTNVLKHLRTGRTEEIIKWLEYAAWLNIAMHAQRMAEGTPPPDGLRKDIEYHCARLRTADEPISSDLRQTRVLWCKTLNA